jgi:transcriptional regulator with XRE-family HTH domain
MGLTLYERIRKLRIQAGMSQDDLAHALGYKDRSMITKIESGKVDISQKKIIAFADALHTTPGYLMGWEDDTSDTFRSVIVPNNAMFAKIMEAMTPDEYRFVVSTFEKAYNRLKEKGEIE